MPGLIEEFGSEQLCLGRFEDREVGKPFWHPSTGSKVSQYATVGELSRFIEQPDVLWDGEFPSYLEGMTRIERENFYRAMAARRATR